MHILYSIIESLLLKKDNLSRSVNETNLESNEWMFSITELQKVLNQHVINY